MTTPTASSHTPRTAPDNLGSMVGEYLQYLWHQTRQEFDELRTSRSQPRAIAVLAVLGIAALAVLYLVISLLDAIGNALPDRDGTTDLQPAIDWSRNTTAMITDPVNAYLDAHASGLPLTAQALWWTWCAAGIVFFLISLTGNIGARIGWALYGASTVGMVLAATPAPAGTTAAALTAGVWAVLTVPAYRRTRPHILNLETTTH